MLGRRFSYLNLLMVPNGTDGGGTTPPADSQANTETDPFKAIGMNSSEIKSALAKLKKLEDAEKARKVADATTDVDAKLKARENDLAGLARETLAKNADLQRQLDEANSRIPDDSVVVKKSEIAKLDEYRQLGKIDDLKATIQTGTDAVAERDKLKRHQELVEVAGAAGFSPKVLTTLADRDGVKFELKDEDVRGKKVKTAYVLPPEGEKDGQSVRLDVFARDNWTDFLPALQAGATQQSVAPARPSGTGVGGTKGNDVRPISAAHRPAPINDDATQVIDRALSTKSGF